MRAVIFLVALVGVVAGPAFVLPTNSAMAEPLHRHSWHSHRRAYASRPFHIPRFSQAQAEAYVHTVYPYRTGLYVPWPDAYGAPYPYGY